MTPRLVKAFLACAVTAACEGRETSKSATENSVSFAASLAADTGIVQERRDWAAFVKALPMDAASAAAALEQYRRDKGLPFFFFLRPDAPDAITVALRKEDDEMGCGTLVTAFVRRLPPNHPVLMALPAIEFDTAGQTLRQWPLPGDAGFFEIVAGVAGEELVASYPNGRSGAFMRIKPDGTYLISAREPQPLETEQWIEVADSTWLRVHPKDEGTFTAHTSGTIPEPVGTWIPSGDSGWYVRTDSIPGRRSRARAMTRPGTPSPRLVPCPASAEFEGMVCRGFPEGKREHRIAYPMPCS